MKTTIFEYKNKAKVSNDTFHNLKNKSEIIN